MSLYLEKGDQGSVCCIAKVAQLVRRAALVPHWTRVATGFCRTSINAIYALPITTIKQ